MVKLYYYASSSIPVATPSVFNSALLQDNEENAQPCKKLEVQQEKEALILENNLSPRANEQAQTTTKMETRRRPPRKCTPNQEQDKSINI